MYRNLLARLFLEKDPTGISVFFPQEVQKAALSVFFQYRSPGVTQNVTGFQVAE
jgi:hypothetical protein